MNAKLILVSGYCATGKSTFSRILSKNLSIPCFNKDTLKESMADGFDVCNEEVFKKGSAATFKVMFHIAECFLQIGKTCILESNFRYTEGEEIRQLVEKYKANCLTYAFIGDLNTLYDRYANRQDADERHWVHIDAGDRDAFVNGHMHWKMGQIEVGQVIRIDATDFNKINYDELIIAAENFVER